MDEPVGRLDLELLVRRDADDAISRFLESVPVGFPIARDMEIDLGGVGKE